MRELMLLRHFLVVLLSMRHTDSLDPMIPKLKEVVRIQQHKLEGLVYGHGDGALVLPEEGR